LHAADVVVLRCAEHARGRIRIGRILEAVISYLVTYLLIHIILG
jgi:hypothetical protein